MTSDAPVPADPGTNARIQALLLGIGALIALGAVGLALNAMGQSWAKYSRYVATPCRILTMSTFSTQRGAYHPRVEYEYAFNGVPHRGWNFDDDRTYSLFQFRMESLRKDYPPGRETVCWVDPAAPDQCVLERPFPWRYADTWVSMVVVGAAGILLAWGVRLASKAGRE